METEKNKIGRPLKEFDRKAFEELCAIFCTKDEICAVFDCNEQTLTRWCKKIYKQSFEDIYKTLSAQGRISLRRMQFKAAEKGNITALIFLGKQILGQSDKIENINQTPEVHNINVNFAGRAANK